MLFELQLLKNVALAMGLGALVGFERETADKPAGLRTHMLVAGASALLVGLAAVAVREFAGLQPELLQADPIRVIQAVVTGVSFLGAGAIIKSSTGTVHGLTTGASLLMTAALGVAVGLSQLWLATGVAALTVITLHVIPVIWSRLSD